MMTVTPTRRPWLTSLRLTLAVALLAVGSSVLLSLFGIDAGALACVVSVN